MSHMICSYDETQEILKHNSKIVLNKDEFLVPGKTNTWYIKDLQDAETFFVTSIHNDILYKALQTLSANILFASPIIIFILILIINKVSFKNFEHIIKQLEEAKETYKKFATTDCLTNTFSRHYFNEYIESHASELFSGPLALVIIDIDDFKNINDTYGHLQGDEALREIAGILRSSVRSNDKVVRYGGDEFLLVLKDCTIKKAQEVLLRVVEGIKNIDKFDFNLGISYGISQVSNKEEFLLGIEEADKKMYEMKRDKYKIEK